MYLPDNGFYCPSECVDSISAPAADERCPHPGQWMFCDLDLSDFCQTEVEQCDSDFYPYSPTP